MDLLQTLFTTLSYKLCYFLGFDDPQMVLSALASILHTVLLIAAGASIGYVIWLALQLQQKHSGKSVRITREMKQRLRAGQAALKKAQAEKAMQQVALAKARANEKLKANAQVATQNVQAEVKHAAVKNAAVDPAPEKKDPVFNTPSHEQAPVEAVVSVKRSAVSEAAHEGQTQVQQMMAMMQKQMQALEAKLEKTTQTAAVAVTGGTTQPPSIHAAMDSPYQNAIKMLQTGMPVPDVVAACGLTWGEAELLSALHQ